MILPEVLKESALSMKFRDNTPLHSGMKVVSVMDKDLKEIIDARFYRGNSGRVYCCVWVHGDERYGRGVGIADGYGYHKTSAALSFALQDMGLVLRKHDCNCAGEGAMADILKEFARLMGYENAHLIEFYR
jgi:hypothetical protein